MNWLAQDFDKLAHTRILSACIGVCYVLASFTATKRQEHIWNEAPLTSCEHIVNEMSGSKDLCVTRFLLASSFDMSSATL